MIKSIARGHHVYNLSVGEKLLCREGGNENDTRAVAALWRNTTVGHMHLRRYQLPILCPTDETILNSAIIFLQSEEIEKNSRNPFTGNQGHH